MSGLEITLLVIGIVLIGFVFSLCDSLINRKMREDEKKNREEFIDLMAYFDEADFLPNNFTETPRRDADEFKMKLIKVFFKK